MKTVQFKYKSINFGNPSHYEYHELYEPNQITAAHYSLCISPRRNDAKLYMDSQDLINWINQLSRHSGHFREEVSINKQQGMPNVMQPSISIVH
jgi:hypothetical protein